MYKIHSIYLLTKIYVYIEKQVLIRLYCACVHACMCGVWACACARACTHFCLCVHMYMCVCMCVCVWVYMCVCVSVNVCVCVCVYECAKLYTWIGICRYMHSSVINVDNHVYSFTKELHCKWCYCLCIWLQVCKNFWLFSIKNPNELVIVRITHQLKQLLHSRKTRRNWNQGSQKNI